VTVPVSVADCDKDAVACNYGVDSSTQATDVVAQNDPTDQGVMNVDSLPQDSTEGGAAGLIAEQKADPTLASCWRQADAGKGDFLAHKGLLYHRDQVEGESVWQLCVPQFRRASLLRLAHESVFGGHLAERKTRERIRLSFYWPELRKSVLQQYANVVTVSYVLSRWQPTVCLSRLRHVVMCRFRYSIWTVSVLLSPRRLKVIVIVCVLWITVHGGHQCIC